MMPTPFAFDLIGAVPLLLSGFSHPVPSFLSPQISPVYGPIGKVDVTGRATNRLHEGPKCLFYFGSRNDAGSFRDTTVTAFVGTASSYFPSIPGGFVPT